MLLVIVFKLISVQAYIVNDNVTDTYLYGNSLDNPMPLILNLYRILLDQHNQQIPCQYHNKAIDLLFHYKTNLQL